MEVVRKDIFHVISGSVDPGLYRADINSNRKSVGIIPNLRVNQLSDQLITSNSVQLQSDHTFSDGDILLVGKGGAVRAILSKSANANTLLVTERCDNLCEFCSQPPKEANDDVLFGMAAQALTEFQTSDLVGISGGEPFLSKKIFLAFMSTLNSLGCRTPLHILSNGRALQDISFTKKLADVCQYREVSIGIPLHGVRESTHDSLTAAPGSWKETIDGLINAGHMGFNIELRFIPTLDNLSELEKLIVFVGRTMPFISQLSIMNLEPHGWAKKNWKSLYRSPVFYSKTLESAVKIGERLGVNTRLFNYPLCHLKGEYLRNKAERSISDWKNYYPDECNDCAVMDKCCGYFKSSKNMFLEKPRKWAI